MSDPQTPPWLNGSNTSSSSVEAEGRPAGNPRWVPGMPSPNPNGRPKGATSKSKLMERMLADADGIVDSVIAKALDGDTAAASLILSRVLPGLKAQAEKVQFDFDVDAPISQQVEAVLSAVSGGIIAPDVGKQIIEAIASLSQVRASEELEARIVALEEARGA